MSSSDLLWIIPIFMIIMFFLSIIFVVGDILAHEQAKDLLCDEGFNYKYGNCVNGETGEYYYFSNKVNCRGDWPFSEVTCLKLKDVGLERLTT